MLNFGSPGANTPEHRNLVGSLVPRIHPDFVLLQWYVNDMEDDDVVGRPTFEPLIPIRRLHGWLSDKSALYTVANMRWAEAQMALGMDHVVCGVSASPPRQSRRAAMRELDRDLLRDLIAMLQASRRADRHRAFS